MKNKELRAKAQDYIEDNCIDKNTAQVEKAYIDGAKMVLANPSSDIHHVSNCGLTNEEVKERDILIRLQSDDTRWFTQEEFERLKELSNKMFKNAG